jgi:alpha-L-rhamnosidase
MGWMADGHLYAEAAMYNFDMAAFYTNWLRDMRDEQGEDGAVSDTVPRARFAVGPADPSWGAAYPLVLWYAYEQYGDRRLLEQHFAGIKAWSDFLQTKARPDGTTDFVKYGDWVPVDFTSGTLTSTAYSYVSADIAAKVAHVLGKTSEEQALRARAEAIRKGFNARYFDAAKGYYDNGSQGAQVLANALGLATKETSGRSLSHLFNEIAYHSDSHLTTGILATKHLLPLLGRMGDLDLAYDVATQTTYPGWGYMIEQGATTVWELWQKRTGPSMNSHNHAMFGSIGDWFITDLAGIRRVAGGEGYTQVRIQPGVTRELRWAAGNFETQRGTVASSWRRLDDGLRLEVAVPFGSTATIVLPKLQLRDVTLSEGGVVAWRAGAAVAPVAGVKSIHESAEDVEVEAGAGRYVFALAGR